MADQYNHSDFTIGNSYIVKRMMLEEQENSNHFGMSKYMNNYADFFQDELKAIDSSEVKSKKQLIQSLNIKGRFIHHNYESNQ